jgi:hypothetical protein
MDAASFGFWMATMAIIAILGVGVFVPLNIVYRNRIRAKAREKQLSTSLPGRRIGVVCQRPGGSQTDIEARIIARLRQYDAICSFVDRDLALSVLRGVDIYRSSSALDAIDCVIAATLIEKTVAAGHTIGHTEDFLRWASVRYPNWVEGANFLEDSGAARIYKRYRKETDKMAKEMIPVTKVALTLDYRVVTRSGINAGSPTASYTYSNERSGALRSLVDTILDTLTVEHRSLESKSYSLFDPLGQIQD